MGGGQAVFVAKIIKYQGTFCRWVGGWVPAMKTPFFQKEAGLTMNVGASVKKSQKKWVCKSLSEKKTHFI